MITLIIKGIICTYKMITKMSDGSVRERIETKSNCMVNPTSQNIGQVSHTNTTHLAKEVSEFVASPAFFPPPPSPSFPFLKNFRTDGDGGALRWRREWNRTWLPTGSCIFFVDSRRQLTYFSPSRIFILIPSIPKYNCSVVMLLCNILICIKSDRFCRSCRKPFPPHLSVACERSRFTFD